MADVPSKRGKNSPVIGDNGMLTNAGDNARYLRHALAAWNLPPIDISDAKQVEDRLVWYFNHCAEDDMKPTVNGMCNSLGISRDTLCDWKNGDNRAATHLDIIKKAYKILEQMWESYMMNGKINPVSGIFLGKNMFGYQDKQDIVVTPNNPLGDSTDPATIAQKYAELPGD